MTIRSIENTDTLQAHIRDQGISASQYVIQYVTDMIANGHYSAGERLIESKLSKELAIGRGAIREAFRCLESDGLIQLEPNKGALVRTFGAQEMDEILLIREHLEGLAATLACTQIDTDNNRELAENKLAQIKQVLAGEITLDFAADNIDFHQLINTLSKNNTLTRQIEQLQKPTIRSWFLHQLNEDYWLRSLKEHKLILETILDRDSVLAEHLMRAHVRRSRFFLANSLK